MKRFISLILILCFYTQSINTNNLFYVGLNQAKATSPEALNTEISDACSGDDGCAYDYDGEGSTDGDGWRIAFEQVILIAMSFLSIGKVSHCLKHKAKWAAPNATSEKKNKCIGWGEALEMGVMLALIIGEIIQTVMVTTKVKEELRDSNHREVLRGALNDTDNGDENDYTIKITGSLGSLKKQCEGQEASGEELDEECSENEQLGPLLALRRILQTQAEAAGIKLGIYGVASAALILTTIADIAAATKEIIQDAAKMTKKVAVCTAAEATSSTGIGAIATGACTAACVPFKTACIEFYKTLNIMKFVPNFSCTEGMTLSSLNISCGVASNAQGIACAAFAEKAGEAIQEIANATQTVSTGDQSPKCKEPGLTPSMNNKNFDKGLELISSVVSLVSKRAEAQRVNLHGDDWTHAMRMILSIAGPFIGGIAGFYTFSAVLDKVTDAWAYFNEKRPLCMEPKQY